ncbi:hypothetical protein [Defluviitalea phaphyphila]|nr:hypothetical protein [Defluviitalea phaphyphila]
MEALIIIFVSLFSFYVILLLSSQCESYAIKKSKKLLELLLKNKRI